jgi:4-amino-4-deoxy-L-arabinose transferase-like glycosyltransferase
MTANLRRLIEEHPAWTLALTTVAMLLPFLARPFDIDDPLFVWAAKQIQAHPLAPYSFDVNWYGSVMPMWKITENPPLGPAFLALGASVFGWSEWALHLTSLLPAIAVVLGTYRLAGKFCARPMLAGLAVLFAPVFLVSSTSVMCDVPMLACWIWAVVFWVEGLENQPGKLFLSALLIATAAMTKYYGACLMPLLAAYALALRRPLRGWAPFLLIPLLVLCFYQYVTQAAYGYSLLYRAMDYAKFSQQTGGAARAQAGIIALIFVGGGIAPVIFLAPAWMNRRWFLAMLCVLEVFFPAIFASGFLWKNYSTIATDNLTLVKVQCLIWLVAGFLAMAMALVEWLRRKDAVSLLLMLWVLGTFWFAAFSNWTVNARSILPMTPALAILVARRLENQKRAQNFMTGTGLFAGAALSLMVAHADFQRAEAVCQSAAAVHERFHDAPGRLWSQGHWGFQFYMEAGGATEQDFRRASQNSGDLIVVPHFNTDNFVLDTNHAWPLGDLKVSGPRCLTTWNPETGAGFYAAAFGPLPFAFGVVPPEAVSVFEVKPPATGGR